MKNKTLSPEHEEELESLIFTGGGQDLILAELKRLHAKKIRLFDLTKDINTTPLVIELTGTPRSGKTSCINNIRDFFKKGGFEVELLEEPANKINITTTNQTQLKNISDVEFNHQTLKIALDALENALKGNFDIILLDRGVLDNYIWYNMFYNQCKITLEEHKNYFENQITNYKDLIDSLIITFVDEKEAVKRDYLNSITLEPRRKINTDKIAEYNKSIDEVRPYFEKVVKDIFPLDTKDRSIVESSIVIADHIMDVYEEKINQK